MDSVIVDTNVPVVANGLSTQATSECALNCIQQIKDIIVLKKLVLDDCWRIIREYMNNLHSSGQPGVGDEFLKWVLINWANSERCELITITPLDPTDPHETDFAEFPNDPALANFDPSDRKFVAVALAHPEHPPVLNATDTDWWNYRNILNAYGVKIEFLCEKNIQRILGVTSE